VVDTTTAKWSLSPLSDTTILLKVELLVSVFSAEKLSAAVFRRTQLLLSVLRAAELSSSI
jgi:hypothetical protein